MKRNFEPSDKGLKCFIEQHGITLKINKTTTNTINSPQDPSGFGCGIRNVNTNRF